MHNKYRLRVFPLKFFRKCVNEKSLILLSEVNFFNKKLTFLTKNFQSRLFVLEFAKLTFLLYQIVSWWISDCRLKTHGCLRLGDVTTLNLTNLKVTHSVINCQSYREKKDVCINVGKTNVKGRCNGPIGMLLYIETVWKDEELIFPP